MEEEIFPSCYCFSCCWNIDYCCTKDLDNITCDETCPSYIMATKYIKFTYFN